MTDLCNNENVKQNYKTQDNLAVRRGLHQKYGRYEYAGNCWSFDKYLFREGDNILELGCGYGAMWVNRIDSLPAGAKLTLTDLSAGMIDAACSKFGNLDNVTAEIMDIQDIRREYNSFDVVIANSMLYHVPDLSRAVAEVYRVLKPGVLFYVSTFGGRGTHVFFNDTLKMSGCGVEAFGPDTYGFTTENGREVLKGFFKDVILYEGFDYLLVTDVQDIVDYLFSTFKFANVDKSMAGRLYEFYTRMKDENGAVKIPRHFGMFTAQK